jgi:hypothetical protein
VPRTYKKIEWVRKYLVNKALTECRKYARCIERELLHDERKLKRNEREAIWREKNREKIRNRTNKWCSENRDIIRIKRKIYVEKNKDHFLFKSKKRYREKYEYLRKQAAEWREKNRESIREYANKKYHELKHTETYMAGMRARGMKRYTAKKKRCPIWLSKDDEWIIKEAYKLAYMRKKLFNTDWHLDHIIPLRGKLVSGLHVPLNIQIVPAKWNLYKNNKHTERFFE